VGGVGCDELATHGQPLTKSSWIDGNKNCLTSRQSEAIGGN